MDPRYDVLEDAARLARDVVDSLAERHAGADRSADAILAALRSTTA